MTAVQKNINAVRVHEGDEKVVLHPGNNDLFVRTGKQVIDACQMDISIQVWMDELNTMFSQVGQWCAARADKIVACFAQGRGAKVLLLFVPAGQKFDFNLSTELAILNRELVTGLNIGMVEVGQVPASEVDRFLDTEKAKLIYGKLPKAPESVAAQS